MKARFAVVSFLCIYRGKPKKTNNIFVKKVLTAIVCIC